MIVFQRRVATPIAAWIGLVLVVSIAAAIDARYGGDIYRRVALVPERVWRGELWRLVTWAFVEIGPWSLAFGCIAIYSFGGGLLGAWGARRFTQVFVAIGLFTGVVTAAVVALAFPDASHGWYFGAGAIGDALLVAWGLTFPRDPVRISMIVVIEGRLLAYGFCALAVLYAIFFGVVVALPHLLACGAAYAIAGGSLPRWWRRRMRVVRGGGKPSEPTHGPYYTN